MSARWFVLIIEFVNDMTGDEVIGNYDVRVVVNGRVVATDRVTNHPRQAHWRVLLRRLLPEPVAPATK